MGRMFSIGVAALVAAALTVAGSATSATAPAPSASQAQTGSVPLLGASNAGTYTWTHTNRLGQVVFTRSGPAPSGPMTAGPAGPPTAGPPTAGPPLSGGVTPGAVGIDACCSYSGCDTVDVTRDLKDYFGLQTLGRFHHRVYWCWAYPKITGVSVSCYGTDLSSWFGVQYYGCSDSGYYYSWSGSPQGGHYSLRQGDFQQCLIKFGCGAHTYPWIKIWVNGNGAWTQEQGG